MLWLKNTRATGIGFMLLGLVVLALSFRLEGPRHMPHGPGVFPSAIGVLMALAGLVVALGRDPNKQAATDDQQPRLDAAPGTKSQEPERILAFIMFAAAPLVYALVLPTIGFLIVTPPLLAVLVIVSGGRWPVAIATGVIGTLLLQTVFQQVMRVPLPWGILEQYAGVLTWM